MVPATGSNAVIVSTPLGTVTVAPTATVTPLIVTVAGPSPPVKPIVPLVVLIGAGACEPGDSLPRAGKPASATIVAAVPATGSEVIIGTASPMVIVRLALEALPSASVRV